MLKATLLSAALGGAAEALNAGATAELSFSRRDKSPTMRSTGSPPAPPDSVQTQWTSGAKIWTTAAEQKGRSNPEVNLFNYNPDHVFVDGEEVCLSLDDVTLNPDLQSNSDLMGVISLADGFDARKDVLRSLRFKHVTGHAHSVQDLIASGEECQQSESKNGWDGVKIHRWKPDAQISTTFKGGMSHHIFTYTPVSLVNYGNMTCLPKEYVQWNADVVAANAARLDGVSVVVGDVRLKSRVQGEYGPVESLVFKLHREKPHRITNLRFSAYGCEELNAQRAARHAERHAEKAHEKKVGATWTQFVQTKKADKTPTEKKPAATKTG